MNQILSYGIPAVAVTFAAVVAGWFTIKNRREADKATSTNSVPPTWPEIWERMDALEKRITVRDIAFGNILEAIAKQWPKNTPRPTFNQADLDALSDTIPSEWLTRKEAS